MRIVGSLFKMSIDLIYSRKVDTIKNILEVTTFEELLETISL